jgi:hypothetical protein
MVLVCNAPREAAKLLEGLDLVQMDARRAQRMRGGGRCAADYGPARAAITQTFPAEDIV